MSMVSFFNNVTIKYYFVNFLVTVDFNNNFIKD